VLQIQTFHYIFDLHTCDLTASLAEVSGCLFVQDTSLDTVQFALRHFRVVEQAVPEKSLFGVEVFYQEQETRLRPENCTIIFPTSE